MLKLAPFATLILLVPTVLMEPTCGKILSAISTAPSGFTKTQKKESALGAPTTAILVISQGHASPATPPPILGF